MLSYVYSNKFEEHMKSKHWLFSFVFNYHDYLGNFHVGNFSPNGTYEDGN